MRFLASFALAVIGFAVIAGPFSVWDQGDFLLNTTQLLWLGVALFLASMAALRFDFKQLAPSSAGFGLGLLLVFVSDWLCHGYNFFQGPTIRGEIMLGALLYAVFLRSTGQKIWSFLALGAALLIAFAFFLESRGQLLISDDHSTFFYRLALLKEQFPQIPFYYPLWNGGIDARDFFATGALNVFFIMAPIIYFTNLLHSYNVVVALLAFGLLPLSIYFAARLEKLSPKATSLAVILALSNGLIWYRWGFKYGTLGFLTSAMLVPLNLSLISKLISKDEPANAALAVFSVIPLTLMLLWAPMGAVLIPAAVIALIRARSLIRRKHLWLLAALLVALNLPWLSVLWSVSKVGHFLESEKPTHEINLEEPTQQQPQAKSFRHSARLSNLPKKALTTLRDTAISTNPLIIFFALPGLFLLSSATRWLLIPTGIWLLCLGTLVVPLKPQLEFDRMLLVLTLSMCIPAALGLVELFEKARGILGQALAALAAGFLLCGPFVAAGVLLNRSIVQYHFADSDLSELVNAIESAPGTGRTLFSGFVLHQLCEGHLAPLTVLTHKPLMASSQFHNLWRYTQIVPKSFIERGEAGIEEYFDLYNVSAVFAHEREWRKYFIEHPQNYKLLQSAGGFMLWQRLNFPDSYIHSGAGELVKQSDDSVVVIPKSQELVLKFNYFPFLRAPGCRLEPYQAAPEVTLVELKDCPLNEPVTIKAAGPVERLFGKD